MPTLSTITIDDGQATPVAHDFVPRGMPNGSAIFVDSDGIIVGDSILSIASKLDARRKVRIQLKLPQTATLAGDGNPTEVISRSAYVRIEFDFDRASTEDERADAYAFVHNLLDSSQTDVRSVIVDNLDYY